MKINLVDTPGHADFGGEVERALALVDGVLLLVDAAEGPLPQTRYVLSKALAAGLPAVVVLNKVDRADARPDEVLDEVYELFLDLGADDARHRVPDRLGRRPRRPRRSTGIGMPGARRRPHARCSRRSSPPSRRPAVDPDGPLQALVTNLDASDYLGRLAIGRVVRGTLRKGDRVALLDEEVDEGEKPLERRLTGAAWASPASSREEVDEREAGDLFVVAGFPEVEIGDTLADPAAARGPAPPAASTSRCCA